MDEIDKYMSPEKYEQVFEEVHVLDQQLTDLMVADARIDDEQRRRGRWAHVINCPMRMRKYVRDNELFINAINSMPALLVNRILDVYIRRERYAAVVDAPMYFYGGDVIDPSFVGKYGDDIPF